MYGLTKRARRGALRALGLWSREHYDVEVVMEDGRSTCKKITFKTERQAKTVAANLHRYGQTPHLPDFQRREANVVWVDYVEGEPCNHIDDRLMPEIADCFGQMAARDSSTVALNDTPYWARQLDNLSFLAENGVLDGHLHRELIQRIEHIRPATVRIGFDYRDPIGPNLLQRDGCGRICAIDVKNLHYNTLVGEGLAKASDRWLCRDRRAFVFDHLKRLGMGDIEQGFEFTAAFERTDRVRRKVERDLKLHDRVWRRGHKTRKMTALLDSLDPA